MLSPSSSASGLLCLSRLAARGAAFAAASLVYAVAKGSVPPGLCRHGTDEVSDSGRILVQTSLSALRGSLMAFRCHAKLDSDYSYVVGLPHQFFSTLMLFASLFCVCYYVIRYDT